MCGIAGKINFDTSRKVRDHEIQPMLDIMQHRGPDGSGIYLDDSVGLGHVRLSIIDLEAGKQPLSNENDTVWVTFNGEIYNYQELRLKLIEKGHQFKTNSDTEVIVHLYEEYGNTCVDHMQGMFAFAIWDKNQNKLYIARDRVGIKPLYYFQSRQTLAFASELKALRTLSDAPDQLNKDAIDSFWCFNYLPGELSMFQGIRKLLPGHWIEVDSHGEINIHQYWDLQFSQNNSFGCLEEASEELSDLLRKTIGMHMMSDVPVGFLLSGGMDSSAVLSYASEETDKEISAFTVGFNDVGVVDERPFARKVAQRYDAKHYEISVSADDFWEFLPKLMWHLDEPLCEPPAVALHYISQVASNHVKVLLSGEGGDEAFGGYSNYPNQLVLDAIRKKLGPLKGITGSVLNKLGRITGNQRLSNYSRMLPLSLQSYYWSRVGSPNRSHHGFNSKAKQLFPPCKDTEDFLTELFGNCKNSSLLNQLLYIDTKTWLPDDLLVKADKVTMASSLELRVPLLDHKVLEFAASIPCDYKVKGREIKRILKKTFIQKLPAEIINRKKAGFPVPYPRWLGTQLYNRTYDTLMSNSSFVSQVFDRSYLRNLLNSHRRNHAFGRDIFSILSLEIWYRQNFNN